jgi:hypothetical protein
MALSYPKIANRKHAHARALALAFTEILKRRPAFGIRTPRSGEYVKSGLAFGRVYCSTSGFTA